MPPRDGAWSHHALLSLRNPWLICDSLYLRGEYKIRTVNDISLSVAPERWEMCWVPAVGRGAMAVVICSDSRRAPCPLGEFRCGS